MDGVPGVPPPVATIGGVAGSSAAGVLRFPGVPLPVAATSGVPVVPPPVPPVPPLELPGSSAAGVAASVGLPLPVAALDGVSGSLLPCASGVAVTKSPGVPSPVATVGGASGVPRPLSSDAGLPATLLPAIVSASLGTCSSATAAGEATGSCVKGKAAKATRRRNSKIRMRRFFFLICASRSGSLSNTATPAAPSPAPGQSRILRRLAASS